ncbi:MAG: hypothetical protein C5B49_05595 [Bdellovibrio sp.]|nr:MAG: hypothetical protein C5B49_05595 [Bdellovibrio sp.]
MISFLRSLRDLFHPRILAFVALIPILSALVWLVLGILLFFFFGDRLDQGLAHFAFLQSLRETLMSWGLSLGGILTAVLLMVICLPLIYWTSLLLMSFLALPYIILLLRPTYPLAFSAGTRARGAALRLSILVFVKAVVIYFLLLLLFWQPHLFAIGNGILGAWVNASFLAIEVLGEVCSPAEMKVILQRNRWRNLAMGFLLMGLLTIPIIQWITPVFGGLWFAHQILAQVHRQRSAQ